MVVNVKYFSSDGGAPSSTFFGKTLLKDIGRILVKIFPLDLPEVHEATRVIFMVCS